MRYLVVPATGTDGDRVVFATALRVAAAFGAHLEFFHVHQDAQRIVAAMSAGEGMGMVGIESISLDLERDAAAREAAARRAVEAYWAEHGLIAADAPTSGVSVSWAHGVGTAAELLARRGRAADLLVLGRAFDVTDAVSDILLDIGRPLLLAAATAPADFETVAIAWSDTAESARAVTAAAPFVDQARAVLVLSVDSEAGEADPSADRLAAALRWRNPEVRLINVPRGEHSSAAALLEAAAAAGAGLLVMGGFGHSRLRETLFGGVTSEILRAATLPVLIAH